MTSRTTTTLHKGAAFTESPRWYNGRLYFVDMYGEKIYAMTPGSIAEVVAEVPQQPSGLGWLPDGRLLVASMKDRRVLRQEPDGSLVTHADLAHLTEWPINDMVVDEQGRAWLTGFGFDLHGGAAIDTTHIFRIDPDGSVTAVGEPACFPNGPVVTPDHRTLIYSESFAGCVSQGTIGEQGELTNIRPWATFSPAPTSTDVGEALGQMSFGPDGASLDAEGCLWIADIIGGRAARVRPGGEIVDQVHAPEGNGVFAATLGGPEGRTLFMCVAPGFDEAACLADPVSMVTATEVDVAHAGRP